MATIKLLGYPSVDQGTEAYALPADKRGALLAYLALQGTWVRREQLAFLFWADTDNSTARANLRQLLRRTKQLAYTADLHLKSESVFWEVKTDLSRFSKTVNLK